jgi:predicted  nucleic acid-binding Zn-ribbon protein
MKGRRQSKTGRQGEMMSISPNVPEPKETDIYEAPGTPRWIIVVFVAAFGCIAYLLYAGNAEKTKLEANLAQANSKQAILSAQVDQTNSRVADLKGQLEVTTQKLGFTQAELAQARALAQNIRQAQQESDQKLAAQIGQVKQDTDTKIGQVSTDLTGAKTDISATKQDLEATKAKLTSTVGDLGVQSGLIARNQEELDQLKRAGERNIFELHLTKSKTPTHVGPIQITLTKTDPKKFKYTMMVVADDKTIEKKDKTADEPVQFYVRGATRPYEIVIFDVSKNKVNGYLSTPKDVGSARAQ